MTTAQRPQPTDRSPVFTPFFEGLRDHRIVVQQCAACGVVFWPAREMCGDCHGVDLDWIDTALTGEVYTFSVFYRSFHPAFVGTVPYATVSVLTDRGVLVFGEYGGDDVEALRIGDRVRAEFFEGGPDVTLLRWVPAEDSSTDEEIAR